MWDIQSSRPHFYQEVPYSVWHMASQKSLWEKREAQELDTSLEMSGSRMNRSGGFEVCSVCFQKHNSSQATRSMLLPFLWVGLTHCYLLPLFELFILFIHSQIYTDSVLSIILLFYTQNIYALNRQAPPHLSHFEELEDVWFLLVYVLSITPSTLNHHNFHSPTAIIQKLPGPILWEPHFGRQEKTSSEMLWPCPLHPAALCADANR